MSPAAVHPLPQAIPAEIVGATSHLSFASLLPHQEVEILGIYDGGTAYSVRISGQETRKLGTKFVRCTNDDDEELLNRFIIQQSRPISA